MLETAFSPNSPLSNRDFRDLVSGIKDYAIFLLSKDGTILSWNEGAARLKGYRADEVIGQNFKLFYSPEDIYRQHPQFELEQARRNGAYEEEGWRFRKDGSRFWASVTINRIDGPDGTHLGFSKITRDLTERKKAEMDLRDSEQRIKLANLSLEARVAERTIELKRAVATRDEFMSIASHELRTPLAAMRIELQLLERQLAAHPDEGLTPAELRDHVELCRRQTDQLLRLTEDILDTTRIESRQFSVRLQRLEIAPLVKGIVASFRHQLNDAGIEVACHVADNLVVPGDAQRLSQAVGNLLSNAIKYGARTPIEIDGRRNGDVCEISVQDHGPGVSRADRERVFDRFERGVGIDKISGFGLGLYIAKTIATLHRGQLKIAETDIPGARFVLSLPLFEDGHQNRTL